MIISPHSDRKGRVALARDAADGGAIRTPTGPKGEWTGLRTRRMASGCVADPALLRVAA
jgi:hypothetical protein